MVFGLASVAAWFAFLPAMHGPFLFDDLHLPFSAPRAASMPASFWIGGVRPVLMLTYWANFLLFGTNTTAYHLTNIFLHSICATLVYYCGATLLQAAGVDDARRKPLAFLVASVFLLHPLQTESVDYIAGRSELLAGVFFMAAFVVFLRGRSASPGFRWEVSILSLAAAAVLSKEQAVIIVGLFLLTDACRNQETLRSRIEQSPRLYACLCLFVLAGGILAFRVLDGSSSAGFHVEGVTPLRYLLTESRVIPAYLGLFLLPIHQNADRDFGFSKTIWEHGAIIWFSLLVAGVAVLVRFRRRFPVPAYGILICLLLLAPVSTLVPLRDAMVERRMYLPLFGLSLAVAGVLSYWRTSVPVLWTVTLVLSVAAGFASRQRSFVWSDDFIFWENVAAQVPANPRAHLGLGLAYMERGKCSEAADEYRLAGRLATAASASVAVSLARALECDHHPKEATQAYLEAARLHPDSDIFNSLGLIAAQAGLPADAMSYFDRAIALNPEDDQSYALRGLAFVALDRSNDAWRDFARALRINPGNRIASENIVRLNDENRH